MASLIVLLYALVRILSKMVVEDVGWDELATSCAFHLDAVVYHTAQSEFKHSALAYSVVALT